MEWLRAVADLVSAIAWPAVALAAVIMLRREIAGLMKRRITLTRGGTSVQSDPSTAMRRVEQAASALASPADQGPDRDQASPAEQVAERQVLVEELLRAATELGWASGASGEERPPSPRFDWTKEGATLLRGVDLSQDDDWERVKARLLVRLEDPALTAKERRQLVNAVKELRRAAVDAAEL